MRSKDTTGTMVNHLAQSQPPTQAYHHPYVCNTSVCDIVLICVKFSLSTAYRLCPNRYMATPELLLHSYRILVVAYQFQV